jgi:hypothetical protein
MGVFDTFFDKKPKEMVVSPKAKNIHTPVQKTTKTPIIVKPLKPVTPKPTTPLVKSVKSVLMGVFDTFFVFGVSSVDFLFARELGVFILAVPNFGSPLLGVDFTLLTSGVDIFIMKLYRYSYE